MAMSIDEGLRWLGTLKVRHNELINLRNSNAREDRHFYGEKEIKVSQALYDVKALDKLVNQVAKEIRRLDESIKKTNAITNLVGFEKNEDILGEVV
jgi:hypothetical protein